ncbi:MAG: hypothetical protein FJ062_08480 [Cyanobacteria bacterium M_DeepCast_100m_m1_067]|nr:hypothetical protein [Cyanobacteria bacterium M_DeepCast_100m_m1_067]
MAPGSRGWLQLVDGAVALAAGGEAAGCPAQLRRGDGLGFEAGAAGLAGITATSTTSSTSADLLLFELR